MSKRLLKLAALALSLAMFGYVGGVSAQSITSSPHDLSVSLATETGGEICVVCHTPHNADTALTASPPLWNHQTSTQTFTVYSSPTGSLDGAIDAAPGGVTLACLSCHDGVTAVDNFGGVTTGTKPLATLVPATTAVLGLDLSNDHPVSIVYDEALDTGLNASGGQVAVGVLPLFSTKVECASCHNVHDEGGAGGYFLRVANTGSALCKTCHNK